MDLGCGQGASSWFLAREGFEVVGVDGSQAALTKAEKRLISDGLNMVGVQGDFEILPFEDNTFDLTVDIVSSAHNSYLKLHQIYSEVFRVLKPGGKFFALFPTNDCSRRPFMGFGTILFMEEFEVEDLLKKFYSVSILKETYQLDKDCTVRNWVVSGIKR